MLKHSFSCQHPSQWGFCSRKGYRSSCSEANSSLANTHPYHIDMYVPAHEDVLSKQHFSLLFNYKNNVGYSSGCPLQQLALHPGGILYYSPQCPNPGPQRLFQTWLSFYARIACINAISSVPYDIQSRSLDLVCFLNITSHHTFYLCTLPSACPNVPSARHLLMIQEPSLKHT